MEESELCRSCGEILAMLKWKIYIEGYAKQQIESPENFVDIYFTDQKNIFQRQTKNRIDCIKKGSFLLYLG